MIKMVVFDMAGTTVDEDNLVYKTVQKAIQEAGYDVSLDLVLQYGAGKEKLQAIKDVLQQLNLEIEVDTIAQNIFNQFRHQLKDAYNTEPVLPQKGAEEVFNALKAKGVKVVLNTGYDRHTADQLIHRLGWEQHQSIDLVVTASEVQNGRPNPDMILLAMQELGIEDPNQVAKIGDSAIDIEEGKRAGCKFNIGITTGAQTASQLKEAEPEAIIDGLKEILSLIET